MKKVLAVLLTVSISFAEVLYTDGTSDIRTCLKPKTLTSIDFPCEVKELYFSNEVQADIKPKVPKSIIVALKEDKETGSLTAVCEKTSYSFIFKAKDRCDSYKKVVDKRFVKGEDIKGSRFEKERIINQANSLMKGMIKGVPVRGYEIKPFNVTKIVNNDDYLKMHLNTVYDGSYLVGFIGTIKNYSRYIDKQINLKKLMQKGWILLYIEGLEGESITLVPQEERKVFIVALKKHSSIPYMGQ